LRLVVDPHELDACHGGLELPLRHPHRRLRYSTILQLPQRHRRWTAVVRVSWSLRLCSVFLQARLAIVARIAMHVVFLALRGN
jgi:hypothetical protein